MSSLANVGAGSDCAVIVSFVSGEDARWNLMSDIAVSCVRVIEFRRPRVDGASIPRWEHRLLMSTLRQFVRIEPGYDQGPI